MECCFLSFSPNDKSIPNRIDRAFSPNAKSIDGCGTTNKSTDYSELNELYKQT